MFSQENSAPERLTLQWRHNERDGVPNHQPRDCLLNRLFRRRSNKTSKFRVTGLYDGNSPVASEFPAQRVRNAENVSIWWRHRDASFLLLGNFLFQQVCRLTLFTNSIAVYNTISEHANDFRENFSRTCQLKNKIFVY